jgi:hypothetical protein
MVDHRECDGPRPVFMEKIVIPVGADVKHTCFFYKRKAFCDLDSVRAAVARVALHKSGGDADPVFRMGLALSVARLFHSFDRGLHQFFQDPPVDIVQ